MNMHDKFEIQDITIPAPGLARLGAEARLEGFAFIDRLVSDWESGANRFSAPGERLLGVFEIQEIVAVGGLNRDPYAAAPRVGRLRHVYVLERERRQGIASAIVQVLLASAGDEFDLIRLRTDSKEAAAFYRHLGFSPVQGENASHQRSLITG